MRSFPIVASLINVICNADNSSQSSLSYGDTRAHDGDLSLIVYPTPGSSTHVDLSAPAYKRLISHIPPPHQVISLIQAIFTSKDEVNAIGHLRGENAQTFIDVIHEVRLYAPSFPRQEWADCFCWAFPPRY